MSYVRVAYRGVLPSVHPTAYVAPTAALGPALLTTIV